jgi:hypothetical protein
MFTAACIAQRSQQRQNHTTAFSMLQREQTVQPIKEAYGRVDHRTIEQLRPKDLVPLGDPVIEMSLRHTASMPSDDSVRQQLIRTATRQAFESHTANDTTADGRQTEGNRQRETSHQEVGDEGGNWTG